MTLKRDYKLPVVLGIVLVISAFCPNFVNLMAQGRGKLIATRCALERENAQTFVFSRSFAIMPLNPARGPGQC